MACDPVTTHDGHVQPCCVLQMQHFVRRRRWLRARQPISTRSAGLEAELSKLGAEAGAFAETKLCLSDHSLVPPRGPTGSDGQRQGMDMLTQANIICNAAGDRPPSSGLICLMLVLPSHGWRLIPWTIGMQ